MHVAALIPWVPLVAAALCAACCASRRAREFAAPICISGIGSAFVMTLIAIAKLGGVEGDHYTAYFAPWIQAGGQWVDGQYVGGLIADFAYHVDSLTAIMMLAITGVGSMVSIYAAGYMKGDPGYARFFAGVSLFIFAMLHLVMADNFVVLFLGWEGVGLASYLLIGHYYFKPSAAAAAMKAFIVNRVGDFGFLLGVFCIYQAFGSIRFEEVLPAAKALVTGDASGLAPGAATAYASALASQAANPVYILAAPFGLMLGAFGKSAQLPLFVWLPDAMEGPSPVSALIHAATMVTAGVYLIARTIHLFELSPYALPTVAVVGSLTALIGAVIAASAFDLKKVFAYSTVSQLGYMFLGVSALSTYGAIFHLVTHAFFKAVLFLTAGSVMHALAGQLDMRKMSGLRKKMPVTCVLMLCGCAALAGAPFTSGFWSKDMILADAMSFGISAPTAGAKAIYILAALIGLVTAFITGYYAFRAWFRVFYGDYHVEFGEDDHGHDDHHDADHPREPHESPWLMNAPLVVLAVGAVLAGVVLKFSGAIEGAILHSTANSVEAAIPAHHDDHAHDAPHRHHTPSYLHLLMMFISGLIAVAAIGLAWLLHYRQRAIADRLRESMPGPGEALNNKLYFDVLYDWAIVRPIQLTGQVLYLIDSLIVDGSVRLLGRMPGFLGWGLRPAQSGRLHAYGLGMVVGIAAAALLLFFALSN